MLPILWNRSPLASFSGSPINRLDALFDRAFGEDGVLAQASVGLPISVWEDEDHFYVSAEVPGMSENDVEVTVQNGMLLIRGERKPEPERSYVYNCRSYGRFERGITLPETVDSDGVDATLAAGVLTVTFPKSPRAKPKKLTIKTS